MSFSIEILSAQEMGVLGEALGKDLNRPAIVLLHGEMGAGKTRFVQGMAKALNVQRLVTSPTFLTVKEYPTPDGKFIHCDLYRVFTEHYLEEVGVLDELERGAIVAVEWPRFQTIDLEVMLVDVQIQKGDVETSRLVVLDSVGSECQLSNVSIFSNTRSRASK